MTPKKKRRFLPEPIVTPRATRDPLQIEAIVDDVRRYSRSPISPADMQRIRSLATAPDLDITTTEVTPRHLLEFFPEAARPNPGSGAEKTLLDRIALEQAARKTEEIAQAKERREDAKKLREEAARQRTAWEKQMQDDRRQRGLFPSYFESGPPPRIARLESAATDLEAGRTPPGLQRLLEPIKPVVSTYIRIQTGLFNVLHGSPSKKLEGLINLSGEYEPLEKHVGIPGASLLLNYPLYYAMKSRPFTPMDPRFVEMKQRAVELREQGYSIVTANHMAYLASDLPWGVKSLVQAVADPLNIFPWVGFGGPLLKATKSAAMVAKRQGLWRTHALFETLERSLRFTQKPTGPGGRTFPVISGAGYDLQSVEGVDRAIRGIKREIKSMERSTPDGVAPQYYDALEGMNDLRESLMQKGLGGSRYAEYVTARKELDRAQELLKETLESKGRIPRPGAPETKLSPLMTRQARLWEQRLIQEHAQGIESLTMTSIRKSARATVRRLKDVVAQIESQASSDLTLMRETGPAGVVRFAPEAGPGKKEGPSKITETVIDETPMRSEVPARLEHYATPITPEAVIGKIYDDIFNQLVNIPNGASRRFKTWLLGFVERVRPGILPPPSHIPDKMAAEEAYNAAMVGVNSESPALQIVYGRFYRDGSYEKLIEDQTFLTKNPERVAKGFDPNKFQPISKHDGQSTDVTKWTQKAGKGQFGGWLERVFLWPNHVIVQASVKWGENHKRGVIQLFDDFEMNKWFTFEIGAPKLRHVATNIAELVDTEMATKLSVDDLLKNPEIIAKFESFPTMGIPDQARVVGVAQRARLWYDNIHKEINAARRARGQDEIPYMPKYVQWVQEQNLWNRHGFARSTDTDLFKVQDFLHPKDMPNPREMARGAGTRLPSMETDLEKLMIDYVESARRDIFYTPLIRNAREVTSFLRNYSPEYKETAEVIDSYISEGFVGRLPPVDKGIATVLEAMLPTKVAGAAQDFVYGIKRRMAASVFQVNLPWTTMVQTASIVPVMARYGIVAALDGYSGYFTNQSLRALVRNRMYSSTLKSKDIGRTSAQDAAGIGDRMIRLTSNKMQTVQNVLSYITDFTEDMLVGGANLAAYYDGQRRLGLKGQALIEWASQGGAKTQSMYNHIDKSGILRNQSVQSVIPFQTFVFDMFNTIREWKFLGQWGATGAYETISANSATGQRLIGTRLKQWGAFVGGMLAFNHVAEATTGRKPWQVESFIPGLALWQGAFSPTGEGIKTLPGEYVQDFTSGWRDFLQNGSWAGLRKWILRYHVPAGTQTERFIEGLFAVSQGEVKDRKGETKFEVDSDSFEVFRALAFGVYSTEEGREYIKEIRGSHGFAAEITGKIESLKDLLGGATGKGKFRSPLDNLQERIGTEIPDDDGNNVMGAPAHYARKLRELRDKFGHKLASKAPELGRLFLADEKAWEPFLDKDNDAYIHPDDRNEWLADNPEIDAALFFWGARKTLRSQEAVDIVAKRLVRWGWGEEVLETFERERVLRPYYDAGKGFGGSRETQEKLASKERLWLRSAYPSIDRMLVKEGKTSSPMTTAGETALDRYMEEQRLEKEARDARFAGYAKQGARR
jgi:hypothetical protein